MSAFNGFRPDLDQTQVVRVLVLFVGLLGANYSWGQPLANFGYGRMTVSNTPAKGLRPLAVILMKYEGAPDFAFPTSYYDDLIFNPFKKSVSGYFLENSQGRFHWSRAGIGIYGPISYSASQYGTEKDGGSLSDQSRERRVSTGSGHACKWRGRRY